MLGQLNRAYRCVDDAVRGGRHIVADWTEYPVRAVIPGDLSPRLMLEPQNGRLAVWLFAVRYDLPANGTSERPAATAEEPLRADVLGQLLGVAAVESLPLSGQSELLAEAGRTLAAERAATPDIAGVAG
jgi:hypothetical protein